MQKTPYIKKRHATPQKRHQTRPKFLPKTQIPRLLRSNKSRRPRGTGGAVTGRRDVTIRAETLRCFLATKKEWLHVPQITWSLKDFFMRYFRIFQQQPGGCQNELIVMFFFIFMYIPMENMWNMENSPWKWAYWIICKKKQRLHLYDPAIG